MHNTFSLFRLATHLLTLFMMYLPQHLPATALDDYIQKPDNFYSWTIVQKNQEEQCTTYLIEMTSQKWLDENKVDKPVWSHFLFVAIPKAMTSSKALLTISGGYNNEHYDIPSLNSKLANLAVASQSVVAELKNVPNQYLRFKDEKDPRYQKQGRKEDQIIAYCWDKFLDGKGPTWLPRLAMTKAVVKAMDTIENLLKKEHDSSKHVDSFVLSGMSKRGWTAWTTAAVDPRVYGVISLSIDLFNLKKSFERHYMAYGGWSPAVQDYVDINLEKRWDSEIFNELMKIAEPYEYRDRFIQHKYIINATGDEFFLPDSSRFYYPQLPAKKHLRYIPNAKHSLQSTDYEQSLFNYYQCLVKNIKLPQIKWYKTENNLLIAHSEIPPSQVKLWQAHNPNGRDFRVDTIGNTWTSMDLPLNSHPSTFTVELVPSNLGWSAFFLEFTHLIPDIGELKTTTDVFILPDTFPYSYPPKE